MVEPAGKNPLGNKEGEDILEAYREFYKESLEPTKEYLKKQFPIGEGEKETIWKVHPKSRAYEPHTQFKELSVEEARRNVTMLLIMLSPASRDSRTRQLANYTHARKK